MKNKILSIASILGLLAVLSCEPVVTEKERLKKQEEKIVKFFYSDEPIEINRLNDNSPSYAFETYYVKTIGKEFVIVCGTYNGGVSIIEIQPK